MQPEFEDETPINPFDLWEGANFKLKICKVAGYWNYDKSEFDSQSALSKDDDELEGIWKKEYSLSAFTTPDQFKTYDELQSRLSEVLGTNKPRATAPVVDDEEFEPVVSASTGASNDFNAPDITASTSTDDDQLSYFARLAEED